MRERSNKTIKQEPCGPFGGGEYAPVRLPEGFPITRPHHVTRSAENAIKAHLHECFEIGYCHEGSGIFLVGERMLHCGAGDAIAIRQGEMHLLLSPQGSSTRWSFVNLDPVELLAGAVRDLDCVRDAALSGGRIPNLLEHDKHSELCALVKDIVQELDGGGKGRREAVMALVWAFMAKLARLASDCPSSAPPPKSFDDLDRLRPAVRSIADNIAKPLSVNALSKLCKMSEPNFRRLFRRSLGASPRDYILRLRIEVAKSLLRNSQMPVLELSLKSGFPSLSNFNRQFLKAAGVAPRAFRRQAAAL